MTGFSVPTGWRVEHLHVGKIICVPPHREVDPTTRRSTGAWARFKVIALEPDAATLAPYHGDRAGEMPPQPEAGV